VRISTVNYYKILLVHFMVVMWHVQLTYKKPSLSLLCVSWKMSRWDHLKWMVFGFKPFWAWCT
jgi:hypothetical protein